MYATRTGQETAQDAVQIFGGRGITRTGMGRFVEHYHRTITFDSLLGGAEGTSHSQTVQQLLNRSNRCAGRFGSPSSYQADA